MEFLYLPKFTTDWLIRVCIYNIVINELFRIFMQSSTKRVSSIYGIFWIAQCCAGMYLQRLIKL